MRDGGRSWGRGGDGGGSWTRNLGHTLTDDKFKGNFRTRGSDAHG